MTRVPQFLKFLPLTHQEEIPEREKTEQGELRLLWTLVTFVVVYLLYIVGKAI
jgi:hypothetical protein